MLTEFSVSQAVNSKTALQPSANTLSPLRCYIDTRKDILNKECTYKQLQNLPCSCSNMEGLMTDIKDMGRFP